MAAAVALLIDVARVPIFITFERRELMALLPLISIATVGVIAGTLFGERLLARVPERQFRTFVGTLLFLLGASFLIL